MRLTVALVIAASACGSPPPAKLVDMPSSPPPAALRCFGQVTPHEQVAGTGPTETQLSPGFLDKMSDCPSDAPPTELTTAAAGTVNDKGDCVFANGVLCHYHAGVEFVDSGIPRPKYGELHCIFPSKDPKSPNVYGTHFSCKASTSVTHGQQVHPGATCGAGLITALAVHSVACHEKCCTHGTLTTTVETRRATSALDVRPDFHMCEAPAELDCSSLTSLTGHLANAPIYGAPVEESL